MKIQSFILFSFLSLSGYAQNYVDIAKIYYANTPYNTFNGTNEGSNVEEFSLDLLYPIKLKNDNAFITGVFTEAIRTRVSPANSNLTSVYTINPKIGMSIKHSEKWSGTYVFLPKIASDLKAFGSDDLQFGAFGLLKYKKNKNLNYKLGLYYNGELFGPLFVPLFGLYYLSPNKKFETNLTLPIAGDANYALKSWVKVGVNYFGLVRSYNLNAPYDGDPNVYLAKTTNEVFGYLQFHFGKSVLLQTKVGYSIGRNYSVYDDADKISWALSAIKLGDEREALNPEFENGMVVRLNLIYRFHLEE